MKTQFAKFRTIRLAVVATIAAGLAMAFAPQVSAAPPPSPEGFTLFGGADTLNGHSYHSFRIPAIIMTRPGTLVAFAEGRVSSNSDFGNIDLVMKVSTNNGNTWSKLLPVATGYPATFGNPTPVYQPNADPATGGTILLFSQYTTAKDGNSYTFDNRAVYLVTHAVGADGVPNGSWGVKNVNSALKPQAYAHAFDAIGPGNGIRLTRGPQAGALVIPARGRIIYSTDRGATWHMTMLRDSRGAEGTVTERTDGSLYLNYRATKGYDPYRVFTTGSVGGAFAPWDCHHGTHDTLTEPLNYVSRGTTPERPAGCTYPSAGTPPSGCQGSTIRYNFDNPNRILFLHPSNGTLRRTMRVSISYDDGRTWDKMYRDIPSPHWTDAGHVEGGYSSMTATADHNVAALIEAQQHNGDVGSIVFHKFSIAWIVNGRKEPVAA